MIWKKCLLFLSVLSICTAEAQTEYKGLQPGKSTREDVSTILGPPVREVSETLSEYNGKVYVQFHSESNKVNRIEVVHSSPLNRSEIISSLNLSPDPSFSQVNSKGKLEEYFNSGTFVVLTHSSSDPGSRINRTGYYSAELFKAVTSKISKGTTQPPSPPLTSKPEEDSGKIRVVPMGEEHGGQPDNAVTLQPLTQTAGKPSHSLTISDLKTKPQKDSQTIELSFKYNDLKGTIDPKKDAVVVPVELVCSNGARQNLVWRAMDVDVLSEGTGIAHVALFRQMASGACELGIRMQDAEGNVSNQLKTKVNF